MKNNLVQRLRCIVADGDGAAATLREAADEIQRLQDALRTYGRHTEKCEDHPSGLCICGFTGAVRSCK